MKILTYEEWVDLMTIRIYYNGKEYQNLGFSKDGREYLEDWVAGKRIFLPVFTVRKESAENVTRIFKDCTERYDVDYCIPVDPRLTQIGMREFDGTMYEEYLAIGADKWKVELPTWAKLPPPLEE